MRAHPPDAPTIPGQRSAVSPPVKIRGRRPPQVIDDDATILAISPRQDDRSSLERIFEKSNWKLHTVSGGREALEFLQKQRAPVIICDAELPVGGWMDIMEGIKALDTPPRLLVASPYSDGTVAADMLRMGGCDVLRKPFDTSEVVLSVSLAWRQSRRAWRRKHR